MGRIFLVFAMLCVPTLVTASYFSDDFNRADNPNVVGNGWSQASAGSSASQGISTNRYFNVGDNNGNSVIFRSDISFFDGVSMLVQFSASSMENRFRNYVALLSNGTASESIIGYGVSCSGISNTCSISDNSVDKASAPFTFNNTDTFAMQTDIWPAPRNWMDVYVWNYTSGSKPLSPTLSFNNGGADYTPTANGTAYVWDTRSLTFPGNDTSYLYLYQVDAFDPYPPYLSDVAIFSNNSSTTLAKVDDVVTIMFDASEPVQTPSVTIAGRAADVATTSGNSFTASTTMQVGDTVGEIAFSINLTDLAGNAGFTTSTTTNNSSVAFYIEPTPEPEPAPSKSAGGSQPVGSSPTAPGYQVQNAVLATPPALATEGTHMSVESTPTTTLPSESSDTAPSPEPQIVISLTNYNTVPDAPQVQLHVTNSENVAAVAKASGMPNLPWWVPFMLAFFGTLGTGFFILRWSTE